MRTFAVLAWLMVPVLAGAYHYGPGQEKLRLDDAGLALAAADQLAAAGQWSKASAAYEKALAMLPAGRLDEARRIKLQRAKVQMLDRQLPEAHAALEELADQVESDPSVDAKLREDVESAFASSQYYMTWLMRLEGLPEADWEPEIEGARQTYRLLAEQAEARGDGKAARQHREDLEGAIRLARMEPGELQARSIPKQCSGCKCNGACKNPGKSKGKNPGKGEEKKDARKAGAGPPPDGSGS
ncbi:hypothetical protein OJF2_31290 [Aquisphaera giovannonii]|uniref:Tetratricopeptide repeat protein n=1 Tax=Aquisphaera giovannonii TaxID=406548 RepID=A0A5B9W227_9BACT|nr:hypothetical protein [Aquisphaera giovannonii]QEH34588.1 hypothetical protein OJF2_31290 [Aquisphaera giovannonii]